MLLSWRPAVTSVYPFEQAYPLQSIGWLDPAGRMYFCEGWEHRAVADQLAYLCGWRSPYGLLPGEVRDDVPTATVDSDQWLIERGWLRLHGPEGYTIRWVGAGIYGSDGRPTAEQRNRLSSLGYDPDDGLPPLGCLPSGGSHEW
jgi:hypothetical protein